MVTLVITFLIGCAIMFVGDKANNGLAVVAGFMLSAFSIPAFILAFLYSTIA